MSHENVEVIQRVYDAFSRRDFDDAAQLLHRDFELYPAIEGPDWRKHDRGRDGLIVRVDGFTHRDEALEAAGLSE